MKLIKRWRYTIALGIVVAMLLLYVWFIFASRSDCQQRGGTYVRGVFWFECVQR